MPTTRTRPTKAAATTKPKAKTATKPKAKAAGKTATAHAHVHPADRDAWRAWLEANHACAAGVWLVFDKKGSGRARLEYAHAVEEALCFGWIDSVINAVDANTYKQLYTPRKATSEWSALNKKRVAALEAAGRMAAAGLAAIAVAKRNGAWTKIDHVEAFVVPDDLAQALAKNPKAKGHWDAFSNSPRKMYLHWLGSAKRPETRARRLATIVELCAKGIRVRHLAE